MTSTRIKNKAKKKSIEHSPSIGLEYLGVEYIRGKKGTFGPAFVFTATFRTLRAAKFIEARLQEAWGDKPLPPRLRWRREGPRVEIDIRARKNLPALSVREMTNNLAILTGVLATYDQLEVLSKAAETLKKVDERLGAASRKNRR